MEETAFYVLGIALVIIALALSAAGLRWERFPTSGPVLGVIVGAFALLVVGTGTFAWLHAAEHQREYAPQLAEEREAAAAERAAAQRAAIAEEDPEVDVVDPVQIFDAAGCGGCHTLEAAGTTATVGPDLDETLEGRTPEFIEQQIVDPSAEVTPGFPPGLMPDNYEETLSPEEIEALVEFLHEETS